MNPSFKAAELATQTAYFECHFTGKTGVGGRSYRLQEDCRALNLEPAIRDATEVCFGAEPQIKWHYHANHGLSSQVCCLNFLMPFADKPDLLARWIGSVLGIDPPEVLPIEQGRGGRDWYVAFEWIGETDYLNEGNAKGHRNRGANATAADAAVKFRTGDGQIHLLLIEWKYTESYGQPLSKDPRGTRISRYRDIAFQPSGPIRADVDLTLEDFFWEPFYQLLRQQMLAWHVERDPACGFDRARVLHLSPHGNRALHRVTSPALSKFGDDAFEVFTALLVSPGDFIGCTIEQAFAPLAGWPEARWYSGLVARYPGLCDLRPHD